MTQPVHRKVAEKALGRPLRATEVVHHIDENPRNNNPDNLVICPSQEYHKLLHSRAKALTACGNPNYRVCRICKQYDNPQLMVHEAHKNEYWHGGEGRYRHRDCINFAQKMRRKRDTA